MRAILDRVFDLCFEYLPLALWNRKENREYELEFVDLGSGAGRPVLSSACHYPFRRCVGIELLESLHSLALQSEEEWNRQDPQPRTEIAFYHGDIFDMNIYDWRKADVILANSTCFTTTMMADLARIAQDVTDNCVIITFTFSLERQFFELITSDRLEMSWGAADVFYHKRRDRDSCRSGDNDN